MKGALNGFLYNFNGFRTTGHALPLPANLGNICSERIPVASWGWQTWTGK